MQTPVIPESAPFDPQQRAWLNGFFAGLLPTPGSAAAVLDEPSSLQEEEFPWHDDSLELSERLELAKDRPLPLQLMAAMAQLDCGACGYQCQTYAAAIADGAEKSLTRCAPGAAATSKALKKIVKQNMPATQTTGITPAKAPSNDGPQLFETPLLTVKKLNGKGSAKDTRFVALDLTDSKLSYEVGDSLGVYPQNDPSLIGQILNQLSVPADTPVTVCNQHVPLEEALRYSCVVTTLEEQVVSLFAQCAMEPLACEELQILAENDDALADMDLLDLLAQYPLVRPSINTLIASLPKLLPRLYSIASSPKVYPQEVHLTVGVVSYEAGRRVRQGVASNYLASRVAPGDSVKVFIQKAHNFALPSNSNTRIIMIGAGTGIAPFRAFLQERSTMTIPGNTPNNDTESRGENWLFFGDQRRQTDFLYERELLQYQEQNVLSRLDVAFSRDQKNKVYVQHRILQQAQDVWQWLEQGAHLYVCGDARQMARDVDQALHQVVSQMGGLNEQAAKDYIAQLRKNNRYQRDVY
ncbi:MAG: sulfite reductase subunit alpha [Phycisphaeraceae bacterium]|nr:sulfite reductase subunit alpha [Phycisphaeraceae bacterium]